jgi:transcriptional regulator with XRE-family HTH domain
VVLPEGRSSAPAAAHAAREIGRAESDDRNSAVERAVHSIAQNLRRLRVDRELTLSALAERAGVAKSTVSLIERGQGNPSLDTMWALAGALGVPFSRLFHDSLPHGEARVVRADDPARSTSFATGPTSRGLLARHLLTLPGAELLEIYALELDAGAVRQSEAHEGRVFEHHAVMSGTVEMATASFCENVSAGDLISFRADQPHRYRAIGGPARILSVYEYVTSTA